MNSNVKIVILLLFAGFFFWVNYRYRNIFVRTYNWLTGIPKMVMVFVTIVALISPALLKNRFVDYFRDYLPDNVSKRLDKEEPKKEIKGLGVVMRRQEGGRRVRTSEIRRVSEQTKKMIASNQRWHCKGCNSMLDATYEVDHIVALDDGGDNSIGNLQALCRNCHGKKTMKDNIRRRYPDGRF